MQADAGGRPATTLARYCLNLGLVGCSSGLPSPAAKEDPRCRWQQFGQLDMDGNGVRIEVSNSKNHLNASAAVGTGIVRRGRRCESPCRLFAVGCMLIESLLVGTLNSDHFRPTGAGAPSVSGGPGKDAFTCSIPEVSFQTPLNQCPSTCTSRIAPVAASAWS